MGRKVVKGRGKREERREKKEGKEGVVQYSGFA